MPVVQPGTSDPAEINPNSLGGMDPFAWWTSTSTGLQAASPTPGTFARRTPPPVRLNSNRSRSRRRPAQEDRRKLITLILTGTAAAGILTIGGISFEHFTQSMNQAQLASGSAAVTGSAPTTGNTTTAGGTTTTGNTPTTGSTAGTQKTPGSSQSPTPIKGAQGSPTAQPTQGKQLTPTPRPNPTPTPKPPPTPTPTPGHTGTVIGHTNQATNSAVSFTNPADGQGSLLIHLPNGTFVACERACTHQGVPVDYNAGSQQLHCPAHGATFNPSSGFVCTGGPGNGPLAKVSIRVNGDGTITTG